MLLHLDGYYELVEILRSKDFELAITADEYTLDDPDDIKQLKQTIVHELSLISHTDVPPYSRLHVNIQGSDADVHFESAPDVQYGRALEVLEFLKNKRSLSGRFSNVLFRLYWLPVVLVLSLVPVLVFSEKIKALPNLQKNGVLVFDFLPVIIFMVLGLWRVSDTRAKKQVALVLKERSQQSSFLQRHKDALEKLIIAVIAALVGAWARSFFGK